MISSANPSEGKSFITVNLAAVIAQSGKRVIIVDADMRKSYLHRMFGVSSKNGLSDILSGTLDIKNSVRETNVKNLYFVGAGTHPGAGLPGVVSSAKVVEELLTGVEVGSGG